MGNGIIFVFMFVIFRKPINIRIPIRSFFGNHIIFVFVFDHQNTVRSPLVRVAMVVRQGGQGGQGDQGGQGGQGVSGWSVWSG